MDVDKWIVMDFDQVLRESRLIFFLSVFSLHYTRRHKLGTDETLQSIRLLGHLTPHNGYHESVHRLQHHANDFIPISKFLSVILKSHEVGRCKAGFSRHN